MSATTLVLGKLIDRRRRGAGIGLLALFLIGGACTYEPRIPSGAIGCDPREQRCPTGMVCLAESGSLTKGLCRSNAVTSDAAVDKLGTPDGATAPETLTDVAAAPDVAGPTDGAAPETGAPDTGTGETPPPDAAAETPPPDVAVETPRDVAVEVPPADMAVEVVPPDVGSPADIPVEAAAPDVPRDLPPEVGGPCPASNRGPALVDIGGYCIDATEVTNAQYALFLSDSTVRLDQQSAQCKTANLSFQPSTNLNTYDPVLRANHPVSNVDWCDAAAFCRWAGKRLCGKIGGGALDPRTGSSPSVSQWGRACTHAGERPFPYGAGAQTGVCNVGRPADGVTAYTTVVGSKPGCVGGYPGVFDLSGNVEEWLDSCYAFTDEDTGAARFGCAVIGGGYEDAPASARCDSEYPAVILDHWAGRGFRCCSP